VFLVERGRQELSNSARVLSFEQAYKALDPTYTKPAAATFAGVLKARFGAAIAAAHAVVPVASLVRRWCPLEQKLMRGGGEGEGAMEGTSSKTSSASTLQRI